MSLYSPVIKLNHSVCVKDGDYIIRINNFFYRSEQTASLPINTIEMNSAQRENHSVSLGNVIPVVLYESYDTFILESLTIDLNSIKPIASLQTDHLQSLFFQIFNTQPLLKNQLFYTKIEQVPVKCRIIAQSENESLIQRGTPDQKPKKIIGVVGNATSLQFISSNIHLIHDTNMLLENFNFFSLGIGGLKKEFSTIFRRAFLSRVYDSELINRLKIDHVRGIILYGPPGTGKTLIARQIGKLLNAKEPKVVNGPEILNKYVGQSEENIRELFKDAELDQKKGNLSNLHIIIFDEIDAICKKRNSSNNFTDQIVNQLLSKIDGVNSLNNILIIGMTNRIDLLDEALLRPGRFEIHIEIGLPSLLDRKEILEIHTKEIRQSNITKNIDLYDIAKRTSNYTGAELCAVVKSAVSYALERAVSSKSYKKKENSEVSSEEEASFRKRPLSSVESPEKSVDSNLIIKMEDFFKAISEIKPAFGLNDNDFQLFINKKYYFLDQFKKQIKLINNCMNNLWKTNYYMSSNYLILGERGTGKTALAVRAVLKSIQQNNQTINKCGLSEDDTKKNDLNLLKHTEPSDLSRLKPESDTESPDSIRLKPESDTKTPDSIRLKHTGPSDLSRLKHTKPSDSIRLKHTETPDLSRLKPESDTETPDSIRFKPESDTKTPDDPVEGENNLFIKIISPSELIGFSDQEKVLFIKDTFLNAYKSEKSIIILDSLECLIDYVPIGPRFSNLILQTIKTFLKMENKNKCFIIGTCNDIEILKELDLFTVFDTIGKIDKLRKNELLELKNAIENGSKDDKNVLPDDLDLKFKTLIDEMDQEGMSIRELLGTLESQ
ncbi:AAA+-type ATPase [Pseudoloma neurophilia]|uniref:Vesicular-fusion protein SEC18 n=1 Tax=Pseudoloma neurophilia TaxID=146866 RepID=A0A0R0LVG3_9MICR|nr:AAA+-type ATPase [Pseudoloma neurophilia]